MASSAAEFRKRFSRQNRPITISVPDSDLTFECQRPPLADMVLNGFMAWPALQRAREVMAEQSAPLAADVIDNRPLPTIIDRAQAVGTMLDEWVCIATVSPRVVLTEQEQTDEALWVAEIPYQVRVNIFNATWNVTPTVRSDFRRDESDSAVGGSGGETLRDEAVALVGDHG